MLPEKNFEAKAPSIMRRLMADFPGLTVNDAAAILGNLGHESLGFTKLQEMAPTVKGSKGGYGWAQWTGPRRRQYEAWSRAQKLDPASDEANYGFLKFELVATEKAAIPAVKAARTLRDKTIAFEKAYERAGVKHYDKRVYWANLAAEAYMNEEKAAKPVPPPPAPAEPPKAETLPAAPAAPPKPIPDPVPQDVPPPFEPAKGVAAIILGALGALIAAMAAWIIGGGK